MNRSNRSANDNPVQILIDITVLFVSFGISVMYADRLSRPGMGRCLSFVCLFTIIYVLSNKGARIYNVTFFFYLDRFVNMIFVPDGKRMKYGVSEKENFRQGPHRLEAIWILKKAPVPEVEIEELTGIDKLKKLFGCIYNSSCYKEYGVPPWMMETMLAIAGVPVYEVTRPEDKDTLRQIRDAVTARLDEMKSEAGVCTATGNGKTVSVTEENRSIMKTTVRRCESRMASVKAAGYRYMKRVYRMYIAGEIRKLLREKRGGQQ
jgi:hypothetical protein